MTVRGLSARTIECYTEAIARLSRDHGDTNPARLVPEQIEAYLLHLVKDRKLSYSSVNHAASAPHVSTGCCVWCKPAQG